MLNNFCYIIKINCLTISFFINFQNHPHINICNFASVVREMNEEQNILPRYTGAQLQYLTIHLVKYYFGQLFWAIIIVFGFHVW